MESHIVQYVLQEFQDNLFQNKLHDFTGFFIFFLAVYEELQLTFAFCYFSVKL